MDVVGIPLCCRPLASPSTGAARGARHHGARHPWAGGSRWALSPGSVSPSVPGHTGDHFLDHLLSCVLFLGLRFLLVGCGTDLLHGSSLWIVQFSWRFLLLPSQLCFCVLCSGGFSLASHPPSAFLSWCYCILLGRALIPGFKRNPFSWFSVTICRGCAGPLPSVPWRLEFGCWFWPGVGALADPCVTAAQQS